ncbi:response regulator [Massilioclostridium coli]|uniref:response regulator n=1 Tax=Massilioclostridium coli TaxID=1870991 RepID=UPI00085C30D4|nr:response regulator [Massilioclostridium coli]
MKKILIVDDEISFLEILSDVLSKDFEVYTATGVLNALSVLRDKSVDCICSDLNMRDGTGLDLLEQVKQKGMHVPFILLSGREDSIEIKLAVKKGAVFISKGSQSVMKNIKAVLLSNKFVHCI